ncbi:uncharacterized protein [Chamaea fasciata]|uniref:uncharacterized protein isoform X2 n=1 Tax=Chamaea fasciata TaxID=190680 RepID=UPI003369C32E
MLSPAPEESALRDQDDGWKDGRGPTHSWDDPGLIVIGNEITLLERTPISRYGDTQPSSPLSPNAKARGKEDLPEANASSYSVPSRENDMGLSDMGQKSMGWNAGQTYRGQKGRGWNVPSSGTGQKDMEDNDMGQMKDEEIKMSISKASPHIQRRSFTASRMHPGAPGTHLPDQQAPSVQGQPGSQSPSIPADNGAGTSKLPTSKEAHGRSSSRMEPFPAEDGLMLLKVPSSKYSPCDQPAQLPGQHSEVISSTPLPSPSLSGHLPRATKKPKTQEQREQVLEGYSRRSPMYCGGKHTSICPTQPLEPLLPDPNKPGVVNLVGTDGLVYRGRTAPGTDSSRDTSPQK